MEACYPMPNLDACVQRECRVWQPKLPLSRILASATSEDIAFYLTNPFFLKPLAASLLSTVNPELEHLCC